MAARGKYDNQGAKDETAAEPRAPTRRGTVIQTEATKRGEVERTVVQGKGKPNGFTRTVLTG